MEKSQQREKQPVVDEATQISNPTPAFGASPAVATNNLGALVSSPTLPLKSKNQLALSEAQCYRLQQEHKLFWEKYKQEAQQTTNFSYPSFPLSRVNKIMKAVQDVEGVTYETHVIMSKACEMFVQDLTLGGWSHSEENHRNTLMRDDVAAAICENDRFEFLVVDPEDSQIPKDATFSHVGSASQLDQNHPILVSPPGESVPADNTLRATKQHQQQMFMVI